MSLEAMDAITLAEEKARQIRAAAAQDAARSLRLTQEQGEKDKAAALDKADTEIKELTRKADEKATEDASVLASATRNRRAAMKARAEKKTEAAVDFVVERIVNG